MATNHIIRCAGFECPKCGKMIYDGSINIECPHCQGNGFEGLSQKKKEVSNNVR